jgi:hypothetical protein
MLHGRSGRVEIRLVVLPDFPQAESDAAIMLLARDYWRLDFASPRRIRG